MVLRLRRLRQEHQRPRSSLARSAEHLGRHAADRSAESAADLGTFEQMRSWGIVYVAVSQREYDRFFSKSLKPQPSEKADYERRKEFYTRLFVEAAKR